MTMASFNLVREPWIPVALPDLTTEKWSLRDVLIRAHEAADFAIASPLTANAVMRYLLAILHRSYSGPKTEGEWLSIWKSKQFDGQRIADYLEEFESRFDLFHAEKPFAQVQTCSPTCQSKPGSKKGETLLGELKPAMQMQVERSDNKTLSTHQRNDRPDSFTSAEAARMLLTQQAYALGGGNSYPFRRAESPLIAGYTVTLTGENLFATLTLNLNHYVRGALRELPAGPEEEEPWWEREGSDPEPKEIGTIPRGLTDLLTWRSRQILLVPDANGTVTHYYMQQWYKLPAGTPPDPFMSLRKLKDGRFIAAKFDEARALWRDSSALIEHEQADADQDRASTRRPEIVDWYAQIVNGEGHGSGLPSTRLLVVGAGKSEGGGNFTAVRSERLLIPRELLNNDNLAEHVRNAIQNAERTHSDLKHALGIYVWAYLSGASKLDTGNKLPDRITVGNKGNVKREDFDRVVSTLNVSERYWAQLEGPFQSLLRDLVGEDSLSGLVSWYETLRNAAQQSLDDSVIGSGQDSRRMRAGILARQQLSARLAPLKKLTNDLHAQIEGTHSAMETVAS